MPNPKEVAVIGAGSWGTAVANIFADGGFSVTVWGRDAATIDHLNSHHENKKYLPAVKLSPQLRGSTDLEQTLKKAESIVCAIPTQEIRRVFSPHSDLLNSKSIVNVSKGIEIGTHARVSEIFESLAPKAKYAVLSGPSFALEVIQRLPTLVTVASADPAFSSEIQKMLSNSYFRVYTSPDIVGVELAGSLKNVIAIASGIVVGLRLGYNAQAAIINRGMAEMIRMGKAKGAQALTFLGLAGMGDLILTCTGPLSRNRKLGLALGEGKKLEQIQKELGGVAEGVYTSRSARELAQESRLEMPIAEQVYEIIYQGKTPQEALEELMSRGLKEEWDTQK